MGFGAKWAVLFVCALTLMLAGCGGSNPSASPSATVATSQGGASTGGGDSVALEFKMEAQLAVQLITEDSSDFPEISQPKKLNDVIVGSHVFVVEKPVRVEGVLPQWPMATNHADPNVISLYRAGWNAIYDPCLKQGLALHEILSLSKIEATGVYKVSERFVPICKTRDQRPRRDAILHALYDSVTFDDPLAYGISLAERQTGIRDSWVSGELLADQEDDRLNAYSAAVSAFHDLPKQYQLDNLTTGIAQFAVIDPAPGVSVSIYSSFTPMTEFLAGELSLFVTGIEDQLSLYQDEAFAQFSFAGQENLKALVAEANGVRPLVHDIAQEQAQAVAGIQTTAPRTPFTPYLSALVTELRRQVVTKRCKTPMTFDLMSYQDLVEKRLKDALAAPKPDLVSLRNQAESDYSKLLSTLTDIKARWSVLVQNENLDRILFPNHAPHDVTHVASDLNWLVTIAISIANQIEVNFPDDERSLQEISGAIDGLCFVTPAS